MNYRLFIFYQLIIASSLLCSCSLKTDFEQNEYSKQEETYSGPEEYAEFHNQIRRNPDGSIGYEYGYQKFELEKAFSNSNRTKNTFYDWDLRGPVNVPGRIRGLAIDPSDNNGDTWIVGSAGGGIWKTSDAGTTWVDLSNGLPNLATTVVTIAESNTDVIYIGTGEGFFNFGFINGDGIFKSVDGGGSWEQLINTSGPQGFGNINAMIVNPENENEVLAAFNRSSGIRSGIAKSEDGGNTWDFVYQSQNRVQDLKADPTNFSILYSSVNSQGIIKSTDTGKSWSSLNDVFSSGRMSIAISLSNPNVLAVSAEGNGSELFYSVDAGQSWVKTVDPEVQQDWLEDQGWYDNTVAIHPMKEDFIFLGGVNLFKTVVDGRTSEGTAQLKSVSENNTVSFLDFINAGFSRLRGGFATSLEWFEDDESFPIDVQPADFRSVSLRFGEGIGQKAHRFSIRSNSGTNHDGGSGVNPLDYLYNGYIDVPFEVWDTENNIQLAVSFRDQEDDGSFNLIERSPTDPVPGREYIFIHSIQYDSLNPDPNIARDGGFGFKNIYAMWPTLVEDGVWLPDSLPNSSIEVSYGPLIQKLRDTEQVTTPGVVHVDHHNLQFIDDGSGNFRAVLATDGGMYTTPSDPFPGEEGEDWFPRGFGLLTSQFYGVDKRRGENRYFGGLQDNGVQLSPPGISAGEDTQYQNVWGGDGFDVIWNYNNGQLLMLGTQFNRFRRSSNGGFTFESVSSTFTDFGSEKAPFFSSLANHKFIPDRVFTIGVSGVWRSQDFGLSWELEPLNNAWILNDEILNNYSIDVSRSNPDIIWTGGGMTSQIGLHVSTDAGESFQQVNNYQNESFGLLSGIATHPFEDSTAYILFSMSEKPKILRTKDLGDTWEDLSGFEDGGVSVNGFPDVAVYSLISLPNNPTTLWAGTEIGIFESTDDGVSWHMLNSSLPPASIWKLIAVDDQVVTATHGRGIWSVTIDDLDWPTEKLQEIVSSTEPLVYPNPTTDQFQVIFDLEFGLSGKIKLVDLTGKVVYEEDRDFNTGSNIVAFDITTYNKGVYILMLDIAGISNSFRIVKI